MDLGQEETNGHLTCLTFIIFSHFLVPFIDGFYGLIVLKAALKIFAFESKCGYSGRKPGHIKVKMSPPDETVPSLK